MELCELQRKYASTPYANQNQGSNGNNWNSQNRMNGYGYSNFQNQPNRRDNYNRNIPNERRPNQGIHCYGCGAPNVMKSGCAKCNPPPIPNFQTQKPILTPITTVRTPSNQGNGR